MYCGGQVGGEIFTGSANAIANITSKTFIIDHPLTPNEKYLIHACLEGPEAGVYYRGTCEITNGKFVTVSLPDYVDALATNFTVQISPVYDGISKDQYYTTEVKNNTFTVYGENGKVFWHVYGMRSSINVEPRKSDINVKGTGPYKWCE